jgi:hypothetical protein
VDLDLVTDVVVVARVFVDPCEEHGWEPGGKIEHVPSMTV